eukprot:scaffold67766_cov52-Cyclotella_meneghiniana.AAC.10
MSSSSDSINSYKVVLLGEGRVGKTSIMLRYAENSYLEGRTPTLQASYVDKHVIVDERMSSSSTMKKSSSSSREAYLSIWDTAGQERFHSLGPIYYRNANGAILVYDITDTSTFSRVQKWVKELRRMVGDHNTICLIIVGNKSDLSRQRAVDEKDASAYAKSVNANFMEVSAKTGHMVEDIFLKLTVAMFDTIKSPCRTTNSLFNSSEMLKNTANSSIKISSEVKSEREEAK